MIETVCGARQLGSPRTCVIAQGCMPTEHDPHRDASGYEWDATGAVDVRLGLYRNGEQLVCDSAPAILPTDGRVPITFELHADDGGITLRLDVALALALEPILKRMLHGGKSGAGPFCRCHEGQPPRERR